METGPILTGVIILILCLIPFIIIRRNRQKKEQEFKDAISRLASARNSAVDTFDQWNNTAIGLDNTNGQLFFFRRIGEREISESIDLATIQLCSVVLTKKNAKDDAYSVIEKVTLGLTAIERHKSQVTLEFYNNDYDSLTIMDELRLAEKWSGLVKAAIAKGSVR